jgi:uncharacterized membrane protein YgdD (TMEM256/DUF423 family)
MVFTRLLRYEPMSLKPKGTPLPQAVNKSLLALAGLGGAVGVGLAAAGTHTGQAELGIAANFLLFHAAALIGIAQLKGNRIATAAGWVLVAGLILFAGDLIVLSTRGASPFPPAAPIGGSLLILGWLLLALSALAGRGDGGNDPPP